MGAKSQPSEIVFGLRNTDVQNEAHEYLFMLIFSSGASTTPIVFILDCKLPDSCCNRNTCHLMKVVSHLFSRLFLYYDFSIFWFLPGKKCHTTVKNQPNECKLLSLSLRYPPLKRQEDARQLIFIELLGCFDLVFIVTVSKHLILTSQLSASETEFLILGFLNLSTNDNLD